MVVVGIAFPCRAYLQRAVDLLKIDVGRACPRLFLEISLCEQVLPVTGCCCSATYEVDLDGFRLS